VKIEQSRDLWIFFSRTIIRTRSTVRVPQPEVDPEADKVGRFALRRVAYFFDFIFALIKPENFHITLIIKPLWFAL